MNTTDSVPVGIPFNLWGTSTTSDSTSRTSTSRTTLPPSYSVTSSSSVSFTRTFSLLSPTPLRINPTSSSTLTLNPLSTLTPTSPSTLTPTQTFSTFVLTSGSQTGGTTTSIIIPASASNASTAATVPKPFLLNKPLAGGFIAIGIIGIAIMILIGTIWIRFSSRRRLNSEALIVSAFNPDNDKVSSLEILRRVNSRDRSVVSDTIPGQVGIRRGYPVSPVTLLPPQNYRQIPPHHNQPPVGSDFDSRYPVYSPPRSLDLVYNPSHTPPPPYESIIATTRSTSSHFGNEISPMGPLSWSVPIPQRGFLFNSLPVSPSYDPAENMTGSTGGPDPYFRALDTGDPCCSTIAS